MEEYIPDRNITADHIPITMNNAEELKKIVKEKYSNIALASEYDAIRSAGFQKIQVLKKRRLDLPGALLDRYNVRDKMNEPGAPGIFSLTVRAQKN